MFGGALAPDPPNLKGAAFAVEERAIALNLQELDSVVSLRFNSNQ